jgi:hypothetical protein
MDWDKNLATLPVIYQKVALDAHNGTCSPRSAIKAKCLECVGYVRADITNCTAPTCALYQYRPYQK